MPAVELAPVQRTPLDESLERLRSMVSPLTGIVSATGELMRMTDDARLIKIGAFVADQRALVGTQLDNRPGGTSNDRGAALAAAIGEAAERYAASYLPRDRVRTGRARDLADAVAPARFALFSDEQYEQAGFLFVPFTDLVSIGWIDGAALP
ncbi:MAG: YcaO-like family protein, partial [Gaiellaceae bacterium]